MAEFSHISIYSLPPEVLSLIFATVVDASLYGRAVGDRSLGRVEYSTLLASICRTWRRIVLDTPKLWSFVDFTRKGDMRVGILQSNADDSEDLDDPEDSNELRRSSNIEHAKIYLERAKGSLLHVQIGKRLPHGRRGLHPVRQWSDEIGHLIADNASRIVSFSLDFSDPDDVEDALSILITQEVGQSLRNLRLRAVQTPLRLQHWPGFKEGYGRILESLRGLYLDRLPVGLQYSACRNLVELHIASPLVDQPTPTLISIVQVLENNPGLRVFKLSTYMMFVVTLPPRPIRLPNLRLLHLGGISFLLMKWLLSSVTLDSHEVDVFLECEGFHRSDQSGLEEVVVSFLQRTQVASLHIVGRYLLLSSLLAHTPRLRRLRLTVYDDNGEGAFDGIDKLGSNLTCLHTIEMNECHTAGVDALGPGLKALLTLPSVQRVRHYACGGFSYKERKRFRQLLDDHDITAKVVEAPDLTFDSCPSPFLYPRASN